MTSQLPNMRAVRCRNCATSAASSGIKFIFISSEVYRLIYCFSGHCGYRFGTQT
jgi:hypothetical protein